MNISYPEVRAWLFRRVLGLEGAPGPGDVWRLAEFLGECIEVGISREAPRGMQHALPGGRALVLLPARRGERETAEILLEELAHYLCRDALEMPYPLDWDAAPRGDRRSLLRWEERDERDARLFSDAWNYPAELFDGSRDDEELRREARCSTEQLLTRLLERCERVRRGDEKPLEAPPWSAWRRYRVRVHGGPVPRVALLPRGDAPSPRLELPLGAGDSPGRLLALHQDLAALRPHEFVLKYRRWAAPRPEDVEMPWAEVLARSRRRAPLGSGSPVVENAGPGTSPTDVWPWRRPGRRSGSG